MNDSRRRVEGVVEASLEEKKRRKERERERSEEETKRRQLRRAAGAFLPWASSLWALGKLHGSGVSHSTESALDWVSP